jgi:hypothetical protein
MYSSLKILCDLAYLRIVCREVLKNKPASVAVVKVMKFEEFEGINKNYVISRFGINLDRKSGI